MKCALLSLKVLKGASLGSVADWEDELHWANGDLPPTVAARPR